MSNAIRNHVTDQIIAALESNFLPPWRQVWRSSENSGMPTSVATGRAYRGINPLLCKIHAARFGLCSKHWGTFRQWKTLGADVKQRPDDVKPGDWGCKIVLYKPLKKDVTDPNTGVEHEKDFFLLREYVVFNLDQVSGSHLDRFRATNEETDAVLPRFEAAEQLITATGAAIHLCRNDQAYYSLPIPAGSWPNHEKGDYIIMPRKERFESAEAFYETALHELSHWAEVRTGWDREKHGYEMGELVAEMASCFVSAELGIPENNNTGNHASYLANWIEAMKGDSSYIFKASSQASKIADYLMSFADANRTIESHELHPELQL